MRSALAINSSRLANGRADVSLRAQFFEPQHFRNSDSARLDDSAFNEANSRSNSATILSSVKCLAGTAGVPPANALSARGLLETAQSFRVSRSLRARAPAVPANHLTLE